MKARYLFSVVALAVVALVVGPARASAQDTTAGLKAGVNLSDQRLEGENADIDFDLFPGFVGGGFIAHDFTSIFGFQVEGLYSQKGFATKDFLEEGEYKARVNYFEVPVLLRVNLKASDAAVVHLLGGGAWARRINDKQTVDGQKLPAAAKDHYSDTDASLVGGISLDVNKAVFEARYTYGLLDVVDDAPGDDNLKVKNRAFSFTVGVRFW
jgi:hypothetical protein